MAQTNGSTPEGRRLEVPRWLAAATQRLETDSRLDSAAASMATVSKPLAAGRAGEVLRGEWLGHALHPLLTDLPLGCWLGAGLLDVFGGRGSRSAAQRLVGMGLLTVPLVAASGLADAQTIDEPRSRRVAVVHSAGNTVVALLYLRSWRARRAGHHGLGRVFGLAGGMLAWYTGYLGGHLSFGRGVGQGLRGLRLQERRDDELVDVGGAAPLRDLPAEPWKA